MKQLTGYEKISAPKLAEKYSHNYELQIRDWEQNFKEPLLKLSMEKTKSCYFGKFIIFWNL